MSSPPPDPERLTPAAAELYRQYAEAYSETLMVGSEEPSAEGLDPELVAEIRTKLEAEWWKRVRRIYRSKPT